MASNNSIAAFCIRQAQRLMDRRPMMGIESEIQSDDAEIARLLAKAAALAS